MYAGHFAAGLALRGRAPRVPLIALLICLRRSMHLATCLADLGRLYHRRCDEWSLFVGNVNPLSGHP